MVLDKVKEKEKAEAAAGEIYPSSLNCTLVDTVFLHLVQQQQNFTTPAP